MTVRHVIVAFGVGITAFLASVVLGFELVFGPDFPSVFYVLPIAIAVAIVAIVASYALLVRRAGRALWAGLVGIAAFGYAVNVVLLIQYAVPQARDVLVVERIAIVGLLAALVLAIVAWAVPTLLREPRSR